MKTKTVEITFYHVSEIVPEDGELVTLLGVGGSYRIIKNLRSDKPGEYCWREFDGSCAWFDEFCYWADLPDSEDVVEEED